MLSTSKLFFAAGTLLALGVGVYVYREPFELPKLYELADEPLDLASGDLDNDGNTDIVVVHRSGMSASIFLGDGRGALEELEKIEPWQGGYFDSDCRYRQRWQPRSGYYPLLCRLHRQ